MRGHNITVEPVRLTDIFIVGERRPVSETAVQQIASSVESIGLQHPITIRYVDLLNHPEEGELHGAYVLVAGRHRLAAYEQLGRERIDCVVLKGDELQARKWEIAENLHRADLTELQRKEQIAEWIAITEAERNEAVSAQVAPKPQGGRPESGVNAASRELGVERTEAQRAVKIASISEEAKQAAIEAHLDNNQSALLKIARAEPAQQLAVVADIAEAKATKLDTDIKNRAAEEMAEAIVEHMPHALHGMMKENAWVCAKPLAIALTNLLGGAIIDKGAA